MNNNKPLAVSHCFEWNLIPDEAVRNFLSEFAWNGVKNLTFTEHQGFRFLREEEYFSSFCKMASEFGIAIEDVHAPCGKEYDLDIPHKDAHEKLVAAHKKCIGHYAASGVKTYTVHIGAAPYVWEYEGKKWDLEELRPWAVRTLEELLPAAEKAGLVICVENSFEPPNTPDEVLYYVNYFDSPVIRCCFDAGHANYMRGKGKELARYAQSFRENVWRNDLLWEDAPLEKMLPFMVTCHLHDNDGYSDAHILPGKGTGPWEEVLAKLAAAPHLISIQDEARNAKYAIPIGEAAGVFRKIEAKLEAYRKK